MLRFVTVGLLALAALLAFIDDFAHSHVSLLFIIGIQAAGLACLAAELFWHPRAT
jgi:hypothetical protein